jgi:hypothetical protein
MKYGKENKKYARSGIFAAVLLNIQDFLEYDPVALDHTVV